MLAQGSSIANCSGFASVHEQRAPSSSPQDDPYHFLEFHEKPDAFPRAAGAAGLYHFCVLVPERRDLARLLHRLTEARTPVQGLVDHHFSESIYLADPDSNGIELSGDRSRDVWQSWDTFLRIGNGGYHHHIAYNLWAGAGAPPSSPDAVGFRYFTIMLPHPEEFDRVIARIELAAIPMERDERSVTVRDPSLNAVVLTFTEKI